MGRTEKELDPTAGPVEEFAFALRRMRALAGGPTYRELARRAQMSPSALSAAASGSRLPSWAVTSAYLAACGVGDLDPWREQWRAAAGHAPARAGDGPRDEPPRGGIPHATTSFLARGAELRAVLEDLDTTRLLTLTGPGGVGKTRLAQHAAHTARTAYRDGAHWIELAEVSDGEALTGAVLDALDVPLLPGTPPLDGLLAALHGRRMLLVLDNCEHLAVPCARLVRALLSRAAAVTVLATSRHCLGLPEERLHVVRPLDVDAPGGAVALLADRAGALLPGQRWTAEDTRLAHLACRRLDGLPLAIEFASRRLRTLTLAQLVERLDERLPLLTKGDPAAPRRHSSLCAMLDWSHQLCTPAEQRVWQDLSVFVGPVPLEAAEAVSAGEGFLDAVDGLVDHSVVTSSPRGLSMLETVREYGQWQLARSGRAASVRDRHLEWHRSLLYRAHEEARDCTRQTAVMERVRQALPNIRLAMEHGLRPPGEEGTATALDALDLASSLWWHWLTAGTLDEGERWLTRALRAGREHEPPGAPELPVRTRAMWALAQLAVPAGDVHRAERLGREAAARARRAGEARDEGWGLQATGTALLATGRCADSLAVTRRALDRFLHAGDFHGAQHAYSQLGTGLAQSGDADGALDALRTADRRAAQAGEEWHHAYVLWSLGSTLAGLGRHAEALATLRRALARQGGYRDRRATSMLLDAAALSAHALGRPRHAALLFGASETAGPAGETPLAGMPMAQGRSGECRRAVLAALGEEAYGTARAEGAALCLDELLGETLDAHS